MKLSTLTATAILSVTLTACGATTGGVAQSMAKQAAISTATSQMQSSSKVSADLGLEALDGTSSCEAISTQIAETDAIIVASNQTISGGNMNNVAGNLAASAATEGAIRSGAAGAIAKVPFGGLFAKAAMDTAANSGKRKVEKAQKKLEAANLRKAQLAGLYAGKNCAS